MSTVAKIKRKYKAWCFLFILLYLIIILFIFIEDPYRLMPVKVTIPRINDVKSPLYDYQRYIKLYDIAYQKPKTIILGSSRVLWSIDPANPLLNQYPPVYNAGILGPPMYEIAEYFKHALYSQPQLKRVILALDFYAFNAKFDDRGLAQRHDFEKSWPGMIYKDNKLLFDLQSAISTLWASVTRKQVMSLQPDGRLTPDPLTARDLYKDFFGPPVNDATPNPKPVAVSIAKQPIHAHDKKIDPPIQHNMKNELYIPFSLSQTSLDALRMIIKTCKERHIELIIYIPATYNNSELSAFYQYGLWEQYQEFERILANLHPFYDFMSWNEVTMNRNNYIDGSHSTFSVGDKVIARIMGHPQPGTPETFGRYVTAETVEKHLKDLNKEYKLSLG